MDVRRTTRAILFSLVSLLFASQASAQTYDVRDAGYVTASKNIDVLSYVVCLKLESDKQPRRMTITQALDAAASACRREAAGLSGGRDEPSAEDLRASILECGFSEDEVTPDMACNGDGPVQRVETVAMTPTVIDTGKWLEGLSFDGQDIWAAESGQRTVAEFDFDTNALVKRHDVGRLPIEMVSDGDGAAFSLVATDKKIFLHDRRGKTSTWATLGEYPEAMTSDAQDLWVLVTPQSSSDGSGLVRVSKIKINRIDTSAPLDGNATDLISLGNEIWVSHSRIEQMSVVNKTTLRAEAFNLPNADIWQLATDANFVYAAGRTGETSGDGVVVKINPLTRLEQGRAEFSEMIMEVTTDGTFVYAVGESGQIWIVSATDMKVLRQIEPQTIGATYAPTDILVIEDLLVVAARQFYDETGAPITDRRGKPDENGAILVFLNTTPEGRFAMTGPPSAAPGGQGPNTGNRPTTRPVATVPGSVQAPIIATGPTRPVARPNTNGNPPVGPGTGRTTLPAPNSVSPIFPVVAGSRGGNVRNLPSTKGEKIGSTGIGQPVTLLANAGGDYQGYPWFKIRMADGTIGYQWGGGTCSIPRKPVAGTNGVCEQAVPGNRPSSPGNRPNGTSSSGTGNATGADVVVGMLDLFGKLIDSANTLGSNAGTNPNVFTQTLQVAPNGQGVIASRKVRSDQVAIYSVRGRKGQTLSADVWSPSQNAVFEIYVGQAVDGGRTLSGAAQAANAQSFSAILLEDNDYRIVVGSVSGPVDFQLVVTLDPATNATAGTGQNAGGTPGRGNGGNAAGGGNGSNGPRATAKQGSGGTLADNRLTVGTYTSATGPSGNIELDEAANALVWSEFCGPVIGLDADWTYNRLTQDGGGLVFELDVSDVGDITGFQSGGDTYVKQDGIMMPGCVAEPTAAAMSSAFVDWTLDPQDSRESKDYTGVPNAYWSICESANYDENSPDYNNEEAYWNCADAGLLAGADAYEQYDHVQPDQQQHCLSLAAPTTDPRDDANYRACMQQAEANALEELEDAGADAGIDEGDPMQADPRSTKSYDTVGDDAWNICWELQPNGESAVYDCLDAAETQAAAQGTAAPTGPDLNPGNAYFMLEQEVLESCQGDVFCLDAAVSQASRADAQGIDYRLANEFGDLTDDEIRQCDGVEYGSDDFFTCLENVRANRPDASAAREPGWDRDVVLFQEAHEYCTDIMGLDPNGNEYSVCYSAYPVYEAAATEPEYVEPEYVEPDASEGSADQGGQEPGWDRDTVLFQEAYDYCAGSLGLDPDGQDYATCYFAYPNY